MNVSNLLQILQMMELMFFLLVLQTVYSESEPIFVAGVATNRSYNGTHYVARRSIRVHRLFCDVSIIMCS